MSHLAIYVHWERVSLGHASCRETPLATCLTWLFHSAVWLLLSSVSHTALSHFSPQENAHFSISESLIAAIELMKCKMRAEVADEDGDSDCEIQQLKQKIRLRRQQIRRSRLKTPSSTRHSESDLVTSLCAF